MLERYLLRYFLAVADQGSFSRAAQQCRVSQPTLSVGIAKLEGFLATSLFQRGSRHVRLSTAGERFLPHARRIESEFNLAVAAVRETEASVPAFRLGVLNSIAGRELAAISALALARDPALRFELVPGSARELRYAMSRGRVDAALTLAGGQEAHATEVVLRHEGFGLVVPAAHSLADRDEACAEDVGRDVMIVRRHCEALPETSRHFTQRGIRPHFALRSTNDERVLQMIAAGVGVTVMPESYRGSDGVRVLRLAGFDVRRTLGLAFPPVVGAARTAATGIARAAIDIIGGGVAPEPA